MRILVINIVYAFAFIPEACVFRLSKFYIAFTFNNTNRLISLFYLLHFSVFHSPTYLQIGYKRRPAFLQQILIYILNYNTNSYPKTTITHHNIKYPFLTNRY